MLLRMQLFLHVLSTTRLAPFRCQRLLHAAPLHAATKASLPDLLVITGPTAVGKSNVAMELCKQHNGEIVSADSVHVYRGLDICSNKATPQEMKEVKHHLVDILEPNEYFTAGEFVRRATAAIHDIKARGKLPVIVGGNTMWLKWLIHGTPDAPACTLEERKEIDQEFGQLEAQGNWREAVQVLAELSPSFAETVIENDWYRLKRLLSIARTGKTELSNSRTPVLPAEWDMRCFFLAEDRVQLYNRIDRRCEQLTLQGSITEVANLLASGKLAPHSMGAKAIGYRQIIDYLVRDHFEPQDWSSFSAMMLAFMGATRRYAKRQYTWYRKEPAFLFLNTDAGDGEANAARSLEGVLRWSQVARSRYDEELTKQLRAATGDQTAQLLELTSAVNRTASRDQRLYHYQPRLTLLTSLEAQRKILNVADKAFSRVHEHPDIVRAHRSFRPQLTTLPRLHDKEVTDD